MSEPSDSPFEFPCDFPVKAMGRAGVDLESSVRELIGHHAEEVAGAEAVRVAESRNGRFISVTVTVRATQPGATGCDLPGPAQP
ncbi:MAG: DUF493 domain-containing protein [Arhodomonas sp.]|nr:DUF493 domain-containing protein [Arhodomonas sp.]